MLAAEANRSECDHKVRSGSGAARALGLNVDEVDEFQSQTAAHSTYSRSNSTATLSPPQPTLPVNIEPTARQQATVPSPGSKAGSSGRLSFLSACFSPGGSATESQLLGEETVTNTPTCEVGIRPSFYWVDGPTSDEQREEAEASYRFLKADCQDEACVMHNFAGIPGLTFVGVFDGHGPHGRAAAKFACRNLPKALARQSAALKSRSERKRLRAMHEACRTVNEAMQDESQSQFDASMSGTTACFALVVPPNRVLLANVGDSRCVLARRATGSGGAVQAVPLTVDAKPSLPEETRRILASGGVVRQLRDESGNRHGAYRVFRRGDDVLPGLAMSRSFGDMYAHAVGVTWEPMLSTHTLTSRDLFLIFGTDGLWDIMTDSDAVDFVNRYRCRRDPEVSCVEALTLEAQERWKAAHDEALVDDISVAILHSAPLPPPGARVSASLPRGLSRAASCNDEANAMSSSWKRRELRESTPESYSNLQSLADEDPAYPSYPSYHSPRPFFQHLYRSEGKGLGSGEFWDSVMQQNPAHAHNAHRWAQDEDDDINEVSDVGDTSITRRGMPINFPEEQAREVPPEPVQVVQRLQGLPGGNAMVAMGSSPVIDIPGRQTNAKVGKKTSFKTLSIGVAASAPQVGNFLNNSSDVLRPIRKAYPSSATLHSVPSWDGAFHYSFKSEASFMGLAGGLVDTPRSSQSGESGGSGRGGGGGGGRGAYYSNVLEASRSFDVHRACAQQIPPRVSSQLQFGGGQHEGKVHRGVPCSSSLASNGRLSIDSDPPSGGLSRGESSFMLAVEEEEEKVLIGDELESSELEYSTIPVKSGNGQSSRRVLRDTEDVSDQVAGLTLTGGDARDVEPRRGLY